MCAWHLNSSKARVFFLLNVSSKFLPRSPLYLLKGQYHISLILSHFFTLLLSSFLYDFVKRFYFSVANFRLHVVLVSRFVFARFSLVFRLVNLSTLDN